MPTVLKIFSLMFLIHTRDHGFPHVTVYDGTPARYEATAKIRLDKLAVIEAAGFSRRDLKLILEICAKYQHDWIEVWNETREG